MENAGAIVFSITNNGMRMQQGEKVQSSRFIVWSKYDDPLDTDFSVWNGFYDKLESMDYKRGYLDGLKLGVNGSGNDTESFKKELDCKFKKEKI